MHCCSAHTGIGAMQATTRGLAAAQVLVPARWWKQSGCSLVTDAEQAGGIWLGKLWSQAEKHRLCTAVSCRCSSDAVWQGPSGQAMLQAGALRLCHDGHRSGAMWGPGRRPPKGRLRSRGRAGCILSSLTIRVAVTKPHCVP